jgi:hypothetical protein
LAVFLLANGMNPRRQPFATLPANPFWGFRRAAKHARRPDPPGKKPSDPVETIT